MLQRHGSFLVSSDLVAPHPVLNGSNSNDVVKYIWVTTQRVLFEFLAGLEQVTARHVFGEIQHMTHNLGLQGKWNILCTPEGGTGYIAADDNL